MTKWICHDLVVEIVISWYIYMDYMDIGGHSRRGHSRKRTRGARTRQGTHETPGPTPSLINASSTILQAFLLLYFHG